VLLYCWHSYSARIGTGLWYASMNYCVHAVMYLYFGLTQCGPRGRRFAKRFARFITTIQLAQMVGGITVTIASVVFHGRGDTCYVSLANSALGLMMYTSYFVLFAQLYYNHYVAKKDTKAEARPQALKDEPTVPMPTCCAHGAH
jgi:elongation of very long chain fatty acids protein 6